ncbi:MAG: response regulator transcription factor [Rhodocyclaceae bacterium]|nr:response regulator transcription factor [Rhodocyclaceae bacterium]
MKHEGMNVFIVEDDQSVRDALGLLLGLKGYPVALFASAESLLEAYLPAWRGCLLIDIRMPGMDGLALQRRLLDRGCAMPVIVMTGHGDVESARAAFRAHAIDFLEKPIDHDRLLAAIDEAFAQQAAQRGAAEARTRLGELMGRLTPRETEVMKLVVAGRHNREIAELLGISARTIEVHKARLMAKLQVRSVPDLVRLCLPSSDDAGGLLRD